MTEMDKEPAHYLPKLAFTDPQQAPIAVLEIMKLRLIQLLTDRITGIVENSLNQFEEQLRRTLGT